MTDAAENKIKSTSQIEVAETLIKVSEDLLAAALAKLPAAIKERDDYEAGLESKSLQDAAKAYKDA
jgi:hypothetical protein